uniref:Uncharacterized protein n=1 Tax=Strongyloides venezuelensis TaxID=75913 RepID=A0A0K0F6U9_STRVS
MKQVPLFFYIRDHYDEDIKTKIDLFSSYLSSSVHYASNYELCNNNSITDNNTNLIEIYISNLRLNQNILPSAGEKDILSIVFELFCTEGFAGVVVHKICIYLYVCYFKIVIVLNFFTIIHCELKLITILAVKYFCKRI